MSFINYHYPIHTLQPFYSFIHHGDLCFDIGANFGIKTAALLSLGAKVIAVEPQQNLADFITQKFPNEIKNGNLVVISKGLDTTEGKKLLHIANDYARSMSTFSEEFLETIIKNSNYAIDGTVTVEMTTLDNLIKIYGIPKYCKIDVEGLDFQVLSGLSHQLASARGSIDYISFEYNTKGPLLDISSKCIDYISNLGDYQFNYECSGKGNMFLKNWASGDVMKYILLHELVVKEQFGDIFARLR